MRMFYLLAHSRDVVVILIINDWLDDDQDYMRCHGLTIFWALFVGTSDP